MNLNNIDKEINEMSSKPKTTIKKSSIADSFTSVFLKSNLETAMAYVFHEVILPQAKKMFVDAVNKGTERIVYPDQEPRNRERHRHDKDDGKVYVSYKNYYGDNDTYRNTRNRISSGGRSRNRRQIRPGDVVFKTKKEAADVLSLLVSDVEAFGFVSLETFYNEVNIKATWTDSSWGWSNLDNADIAEIKEGWIIELPQLRSI